MEKHKTGLCTDGIYTKDHKKISLGAWVQNDSGDVFEIYRLEDYFGGEMKNYLCIISPTSKIIHARQMVFESYMDNPKKLPGSKLFSPDDIAGMFYLTALKERKGHHVAQIW